MASTINGTSTGSGGLITTGDDSGILNIQTNETTAMSIDASQSVDFTNNIDAPNTFGFKNRIINGGMNIAQYNSTTSVSVQTTTSYSTVDRFRTYATQNSKFTVQQTPSATETGYATRVGAGFTNYLAATSSSAYAVLSSDYFLITQIIEGNNVSDLAWGTANAKTITLSFWAYSSLTGTFGGVVSNPAATQSYPFTYTISSANTWTQISVTITGATSGVWPTTSAAGMYIYFGLGVGSTYSTTAGSWATGAYFSTTGATSVVGTNGATFYITGVQLEKGTQATSFDFRDYGRELILCQRYFYKTGGAANGAYTIYAGYAGSSSTFGNTYFYPVVMRATPTVSVSGTFTVSNAAQPTFLPATNDNMLVYSTATATGAAYFAGGASVSVSAEL
jgi:hypothetical protein